MGNVSVSEAVSYVNPYNYWKPPSSSDSEESENEYRDRENFKITPLIEIIPPFLNEIDSGLQKDIANIIISFMVSVDLTMYLSKQLTLDYIVEDLNIYDFQKKECRKKHKKTRAFIIEHLSFSGDEIIVKSPLTDMDDMSDMDNLDSFEIHKHKLPEKYKQIISQNQQSKYIKLGKRFKKIPQHIFWWKAIEDAFKEYFIKKLDFNKNISNFIECNGISELRKHGFLHSCVQGPPLYDTINFNQKWYIEFFAVCINIEPKKNRNSFPYYVIENKDKLIFEMKVVTYSNQKGLGLHMPRYD
eukprot:61699_1